MTKHIRKERMNDEEAAGAVMDTINYAVGFPQGEPTLIAVTLTDEQWNAVKAVLQVGLIIQSTDDMDFMPSWLAEQAHQAWHLIHDQVGEALKTFAANAVAGDPLEEEQ